MLTDSLLKVIYLDITSFAK